MAWEAVTKVAVAAPSLVVREADCSVAESLGGVASWRGEGPSAAVARTRMAVPSATGLPSASEASTWMARVRPSRGGPAGTGSSAAAGPATPKGAVSAARPGASTSRLVAAGGERGGGGGGRR